MFLSVELLCLQPGGLFQDICSQFPLVTWFITLSMSVTAGLLHYSVLMKRGGQVIYMGPLRRHSHRLIEYFEVQFYSHFND